MKCPFCGSEIADNSKFCGSCGRQIPRDEHIEDTHSVIFGSGFDQRESGNNTRSNLSMPTNNQPQDPKKLFSTLLGACIASTIIGVVGLIFGIIAQSGPGPDELLLDFIISLVTGFFALFFLLISYLTTQPKLFRLKKPTSFVDWLPTILFVIGFGVSVAAAIFGVKTFLIVVA